MLHSGVLSDQHSVIDDPITIHAGRSTTVVFDVVIHLKSRAHGSDLELNQGREILPASGAAPR